MCVKDGVTDKSRSSFEQLQNTCDAAPSQTIRSRVSIEIESQLHWRGARALVWVNGSCQQKILQVIHRRQQWLCSQNTAPSYQASDLAHHQAIPHTISHQRLDGSIITMSKISQQNQHILRRMKRALSLLAMARAPDKGWRQRVLASRVVSHRQRNFSKEGQQHCDHRRIATVSMYDHWLIATSKMYDHCAIFAGRWTKMGVAVVHRCVSLSRQGKIRRKTKQVVMHKSNKILKPLYFTMLTCLLLAMIHT